ncbi:MAG: IS66 family transposase, partial [Polaromonas sp.]
MQLTSTPFAADDRMVSLARENQSLREQMAVLTQQLEWFKRQLFGTKSERFVPEVNPQQMHLGEALPVPEAIPEERQSVPAHTRRVAKADLAADEPATFFDETKVPIETILVTSREASDLPTDAYDVIGEKVTYRLAQRPGSYVVIKYVRPLIKRHDTQALVCAPAPVGVIEGSRADVSLVAGILVDKFAYHLPLYRQHQRMTDAGITVTRPWLTQLAQQGAALLAPIYEAQFASIRSSRVKAMDETPIKAGRQGPGKMKAAYFWPVYGERDEVCFPYFESRRHEHVQQALGLHNAPGAVLLTDGYQAYDRYVAKVGITHASCWSHCRRYFFDAQKVEPQAAAEALTRIQTLYAIEEAIRQQKLSGEPRRTHRLLYSKPHVEQFFEWVDQQLDRQGLLPSNPLTQALSYARERRVSLEVFLTDPDVAIDTNHLERALRAVPMGRRAWLFCWTELGAQHVGILHSLIVTCRLHGIDPYTYLVDVLQRVGQHPAARVAELTPRLWKQHFA